MAANVSLRKERKPMTSRLMLALMLAVLAGYAAGRGRLVAPSPSHAASASYSAIAGTWLTHSGVLSISPGGQGWYSLRTYTWCNANRTTNCDRMAGNSIYNGFFATFRLSRAALNGGSGMITDSSRSWLFRTPISASLSGGTLRLKTEGSGPMAFCKASNWKPACGG
jgi:hypothetical protein